jgi:hypothetical protein
MIAGKAGQAAEAKNLANYTKGLPNLAQARTNPRYPGMYQMPTGALNKAGNPVYGAFQPAPNIPAYKPSKLGKIGTTVGGLAQLASIVAPFIINAIGRSAQVAGNTAGVAAQAAGNIPSHIASMQSQSQRERYGGTLFDALGGISSDLGSAAATGLSGIGNAAGQTANDIYNAMRVYQIQQGVQKSIGQLAQKMQNTNLTGHQWDFLGRMTSGMQFGNQRP